MIRQTYFISTGAKSAMFTLRVMRSCDDPAVNMFVRDHYICNLANAGEAGEAIALEKARAYADAMRERIGETDEFKVEFGGFWDEPANLRRGKLSVRDTAALENIEAGFVPFGKHKLTDDGLRQRKLVELPDGYVLFFADKLREFEGIADKVVMAAFAAACMGVALDKGLIAKREIARDQRAALDALSQHVGTIGERREFAGEVVTSFFKRYYQDVPDNGYWINKVRCGTDLIACIGSKQIGETGSVVRFKATIKAHDEYKGVKTTKVNRPAILA